MSAPLTISHRDVSRLLGQDGENAGQPAPLLDLVIVSYNARAYLYQTLTAVRVATAKLQAATGIAPPLVQTWVVDNASTDGAPALVKAHFPEAHLIASETNLGFSKANNLAIRQGSAPWVLLLNPDTLLAPDALIEVLAFANAHPDAGGIGMRQISPWGSFMPESKRGLPTPWVAFYKLAGLTALFPHAKRFGAYYQRHLPEDTPGQVPVLSGAAMLLRREALERVGLLDERFFMYGEDIDLSYCLESVAGYRNYYCPQARLLHYKGRSTPKTNLRYLWVFYHAMWLFAQKHLSGARKAAWRIPVALAIVLRGSLAFVQRSFGLIRLPLMETAMVLALTLSIAAIWEREVAFASGGSYPAGIRLYVAPAMSLLHVVGLILAGAYFRPYRLRAVGTGILGSFLAIVLISYLMPQWNFSRGIVVLSSLVTLGNAMLLRVIFSRRSRLESSGVPTLVVGSREEVLYLLELLARQPESAPAIRLVLSPDEAPEAYQGTWQTHTLSQANILQTVKTSAVAEVLLASPFSLGLDIPALVVALGEKTPLRIQPDGSSFLIGPEHWRDTQLDALLSHHDARQWRFRKRVFALAATSLLLLTYPLLFWAYRSPGKAMFTLQRIWLGRLGLVGYADANTQTDLPSLPAAAITTHQLTQLGTGAAGSSINRYYAAHASLRLDALALWRGWRGIGTD